MKNKMLALSAAVLLISGIAFGFSQSGSEACCSVDASATCCPMPDNCPIPCCEAGSTTDCAK